MAKPRIETLAARLDVQAIVPRVGADAEARTGYFSRQHRPGARR